MGMSNTLRRYLDDKQAHFDVMPHTHTHCSMETAAAAHIPGAQLAKSVILKDDLGYVMAVIPSSRQVVIDDLNRSLGRRLHMASERELAALFQDCELGAIPPLGPAYGIRTVMDKCLINSDEIYFEAGSHEDLVHTDMDTFLDLMVDADYANFTRQLN